ncbi:multicopper oxidase-like protein 5 [Elsinoe australis]|uniref:Multicopper oxidase-like protein 5 n=1 Tax=Elsinoe australis TaxID=40998 RepID=A0A4U7APH7_9PEZI|nr:multicopper oxidase-like protein 5 [Elsinoe australis]
MEDVDIVEHGSRHSQEEDEFRSASLSDDSRTRLLEKSTGSEPYEDGRYEQEEEQQSTCFIDKWWKLVLLLLVSTALLPLIVNLSLQFKHHGTDQSKSDLTTPQKWSRGPEDYILSQDWDFEAAPRIREYSWTIGDAEINPDGVFRPMMLINGQFPGPLVRINEGDTLKVIVTNNATNATSIHWHGMYQNGTNHMDGTVGITQCPIAPGRSFTYEFKVEGQSGTYWYHGHQGVQASDGLFGPLIIHAKKEKEPHKLKYETDRIVMLSDHYHDLSGALAQTYLAPDRENTEPVPDGALINGRNIRDCSKLPHRKCDNTTEGVGTPALGLSANAYHRLRIINTGAFAEFQFQLDEHELAITEVDGTDVVPKSYHRLNINPAQRYSAVVHTNSTTSSSFWMRARMITTCFAEPNPHLIGDVDVAVNYGSENHTADLALPTSKDWGEALELECRDMNTTELVPAESVSAPANASAFYYIRSNFEIGANRLSRGFFNSSSFRPDHRSPTLYRSLDGLSSANSSFKHSDVNDPGSPDAFVNSRAFNTPRELVIQTSGIQVIDLLIHNFDDGNHPMHLHGYKYFVLGSGHGSPPRLDPFRGPDRENIQPLYDGLDLSNPLRRDTASVEAYGWVLIRFVADNPGLWALHCHISWHTEAGLMMQFLTRADKIGEMEVPEEQRGLCQAEGVERGAGPRDEDYWEKTAF